MIKKGDSVKCPECARIAHVVWVSQDGTMVGIQCPASHCIAGYSDSYGFKRSSSKANKNSVFLVKTNSLK